MRNLPTEEEEAADMSDELTTSPIPCTPRREIGKEVELGNKGEHVLRFSLDFFITPF